MLLEVESPSQTVLASLFGQGSVAAGEEIQIAEDVRLRYLGRVHREGALPGMPEILQFGLSFTAGVASSLVANWLYARLKGKRSVVYVERSKITIDAPGGHATLTTVLETHLEP